MRYFGKDGEQCRMCCDNAENSTQKARLVCRSILFGRVPRKLVMWMGMGAMVFTLTLTILCLGAFEPDSPDRHRDASSAIMIKR